MDISKVQFLNEKQLGFLSENTKALVDDKVLTAVKDGHQKMVKKHNNKLNKWRKEFGDPLNKVRSSPFARFSSVVGKKVQNKSQVVKVWRKAGDEIKQRLVIFQFFHF